MSDTPKQWAEEVTSAIETGAQRDDRLSELLLVVAKEVRDQNERIATLEALVKMLVAAKEADQHGLN